MKQLEQARILLAKAIEDERAAAILADNMEVGDSIVGFHCQQAAEKLLKALLSARSVVYRHTHDLSALLHLLRQSNFALPEALRPVEALTRFAVAFRYDLFEEQPGFDRRAAIEMVARLRALAEKEIVEPKS